LYSPTINNNIKWLADPINSSFWTPYWSHFYLIISFFFKVFGTKKALWLLPLFSKEDLDNIPALQGLEYPTRSEVEA
jgi:hypothetical protein